MAIIEGYGSQMLAGCGLVLAGMTIVSFGAGMRHGFKKGFLHALLGEKSVEYAQKIVSAVATPDHFNKLALGFRGINSDGSVASGGSVGASGGGMSPQQITLIKDLASMAIEAFAKPENIRVAIEALKGNGSAKDGASSPGDRLIDALCSEIGKLSSVVVTPENLPIIVKALIGKDSSSAAGAAEKGESLEKRLGDALSSAITQCLPQIISTLMEGNNFQKVLGVVHSEFKSSGANVHDVDAGSSSNAAGGGGGGSSGAASSAAPLFARPPVIGTSGGGAPIPSQGFSAQDLVWKELATYISKLPKISTSAIVAQILGRLIINPRFSVIMLRAHRCETAADWDALMTSLPPVLAPDLAFIEDSSSQIRLRALSVPRSGTSGAGGAGGGGGGGAAGAAAAPPQQ